jgi:hypothetical protein
MLAVVPVVPRVSGMVYAKPQAGVLLKPGTASMRLFVPWRHKTRAEAERYTRDASQARLVSAAERKGATRLAERADYSRLKELPHARGDAP